MNKTILHPVHEKAGGKMVPFAGWSMPLHYGSQIREHHAVRQQCGIFDVSHMLVCDFPDAEAAQTFVSRIFSNSSQDLAIHQARYGCLLNEQGGVIDDLIVYRLPDGYRLISNAGTRDRVLDWYHRQQAPGSMHIRSDLALIAVQGPRARDYLQEVLPQYRDWLLTAAAFHAHSDGDVFLACTGYTGEDGFEIALPNDEAAHLWQCLVDVGVTPAGLGARDSLRLEAGMPLYGHEMDEDTSPLDAGLGWTVKFEPAGRAFIGRAALEQESARIGYTQTGVILNGRGVLRDDLPLYRGDDIIGRITSGGFSPSLNRAIALARLEPGIDSSESGVDVEIRNRRLPVDLVRLPFVRRGQSCVEGVPLAEQN